MKQIKVLSTLVMLIMVSYITLNFGQIIGNNSITGQATVDTKLVIIKTSNVSCNTTFVEGWNFVSFPCIADDIDIELFLSVTNDSYQSVRYYDPSSSTDPWKSFNPDLPLEYIQDLGVLSRRYGYWIYFDDAINFSVNSSLATPTLTSLDPGWNMLGYPSMYVRNISDVYSQLIPNFHYVHIYNASADQWKEWTWNKTLYPSSQTLNLSHRYYGYWVYMETADSMLIDS